MGRKKYALYSLSAGRVEGVEMRLAKTCKDSGVGCAQTYRNLVPRAS
jgi:hypothetical protein